jgi:hypothetical protein
MARGNGAARRWVIVATIVAVLAALPALVGARPAVDDDRSAAELREATLASENVQFSGFAESSGGLALPVADELDSLANLFSDRTEMRVWWRSPADNRVDVVTAGGETGYYRDTGGTWTWEYEADRATRTENAPLALPTPPDLLPNTLARRLLAEAEPAELTRIGADRIAGRDALGLQLTPAEPASSVDRVEIFVDAQTGLPLRVLLFGKGADNPALDTRFVDLDLGQPSGGVTSFEPPPGAYRQVSGSLGALQSAGRYLEPAPLADTLAGLPRRSLDGAPPEIGIYGRGVTVLFVIPLPNGVAGDLRRAAAADPTAVTDDLGTRLTAGPLGILLVDGIGRTQTAIIGTVTVDALEQAAAELATPDS